MRGKSLHRIAGLILAALLLPGVAIVTSGTAQAQKRVVQQRIIIVRHVHPFFYDPFYPYGYYPYGYPYGFSRFNYYNQYVFSNARSAFNHGYHDGLKTGGKDARHHRSYNPERSHYFHDAGFGNYAEAYRDCFARGYRNGFRA